MNTTELVFDCPVSPYLVAAAGAVVLVAVIVLLHRDVAHLTRRRRMALLTLATVAVLMLVGMAIGPKLVHTWINPEKNRCAVLVDGSRSMLYTDTYSGATADWLRTLPPPADPKSGAARANTTSNAPTSGEVTRETVARRLLAGNDAAWLAALEKSFAVSAWRFASTADALAMGPKATPFTANPDGYTTALGDVLETIGGGAGGARPSAIVLLSDGAWNKGRDPSEVARTLGQLGTPVYVIGIGDPTPRRDVAVLSVRGPERALLGDEVNLTAQISANGMGAARLPVELLRDGRVVDSKTIAAPPAGIPASVTFTYQPETPGRQVMTVRVPPQSEEFDAANNEAAMPVEVLDKRIQVLLVDATPRWEFRFLRNVLERDPAVRLKVCLLRPGVGPTAGPGYLNELPTEKKDFAACDLVILGDVPTDLLHEKFLAETAEMVRHRGGALILIAGRLNHYRRLAGTALEPILPVTLADATQVAAPTFAPELTEDGAEHLVTALASDREENEQIWTHLPPLRWSATVGGAAPGATVLLAHPHQLAGTVKMPLLAVQRVGDGKVMFVGFEESWRWRQSVGDKYHYRFWAQAIRWMVRKTFAEGDPRARLSLARTDCDVGDAVEVEAYCLGADGAPLQGAQVTVVVTGDGGRSDRLAMHQAPGGWGIYRATFTPPREGTYQMQPIVAAYGAQPLSSSAVLRATQRDLERNTLSQNATALAAIAEASGGKLLKITEANQLPVLLEKKSRRQSVTTEYSPCRHGIYYAAMALVLGTAWLVRKRSGLA